jgi:hypothetical protein
MLLGGSVIGKLLVWIGIAVWVLGGVMFWVGCFDCRWHVVVVGVECDDG